MNIENTLLGPVTEVYVGGSEAGFSRILRLEIDDRKAHNHSTTISQIDICQYVDFMKYTFHDPVVHAVFVVYPLFKLPWSLAILMMLAVVTVFDEHSGSRSRRIECT